MWRLVLVLLLLGQTPSSAETRPVDAQHLAAFYGISGPHRESTDCFNEEFGAAHELCYQTTDGSLWWCPESEAICNDTLQAPPDTEGWIEVSTSPELGSEVRSAYWGAGSFSADGTDCTTPTEVTINSGPKGFTVVCGAAAGDGVVYGSTHMPDSWDGGTVVFALSYVQTAANTGSFDGDVSAQCRTPVTDTISSTWGSAVAMDDDAVSGSNIGDAITSAAVTPNTGCAGGDVLYWRYVNDYSDTSTTVATLYLLGMKVEYTSTVGD